MLKIRPNSLDYGLPSILIITLIVCIYVHDFSLWFSSLATLDLILTIPGIHFLLIRKKQTSKNSVFALGGIGLCIALFLFYPEYKGYFAYSSSTIFLVLELGFVAYVLHKINRVIKGVTNRQEPVLDFLDATQEVCTRILPFKMGVFLATEIAVLYYALWNWRKREIRRYEYTYHKKSTAVSLILGFLLVVVVEIFVTHAMLQEGNSRVMIVLAILSGYSLLQIIAVLRSLSSRPIFIDKEKQELILKFGILSKATLPFSVIQSVEWNPKELPENTDIIYFSPLGRSLGQNIVLHCNKEVHYNSFYGFSKKAEKLAVWVDDPADFQKQLQLAIKN